jgi:hypothetical protein
MHRAPDAAWLAPGRGDAAAEAAAELEREAGALRRLVAGRLGLRFTPRLEFHAWRGELRPRPAARKAQAAAEEAAAEAAEAAAAARPLALFGEADERAVRAAERRAGAKARREQRFA